MKAFVLAAGLGTRLGSLTAESPKCLLEAGGKAMLEHVIERLKRAGVLELAINLHYLPNRVKEFFAQHRNFGINVHFSEEAELLDTGGGLRRAWKLLGDFDELIVHNADVYSEIDFGKLIEAHRSRKALATLAVIKRPTSRPLVFSREGGLVGWQTPGLTKALRPFVETDQKVGFSGISVVSKDFWSDLNGLPDKFSIIEALCNASERGAAVLAFDVGDSFWIDIGKAEDLQSLRKRLGEC